MTERNPPETPYLSELRKKISHVWAESNPPGLANHHDPIVVQLTSQAMPIPVKQHPINVERERGIAVHTKRLREVGILFSFTHHGTHLSCLSESQALMTIILSKI
jgi:hypothetical protein